MWDHLQGPAPCPRGFLFLNIQSLNELTSEKGPVESSVKLKAATGLLIRLRNVRAEARAPGFRAGLPRHVPRSAIMGLGRAYMLTPRRESGVRGVRFYEGGSS